MDIIIGILSLANVALLVVIAKLLHSFEFDFNVTAAAAAPTAIEVPGGGVLVVGEQKNGQPVPEGIEILSVWEGSGNSIKYIGVRHDG